MLRSLALLIGCSIVLGLARPGLGQHIPMTGAGHPNYDQIDNVVLAHMQLVDATAATVVIMMDTIEVLHARGYGWTDDTKTTLTHPASCMRIASVSKPITAAVVREAVRDGRLSLNTRAFALIGFPPNDPRIADPRLSRITVGHLLDHRGGWDRELAFDPMFAGGRVRRAFGIDGPIQPGSVIRLMLGERLQFDPGSREKYSNFGYCVLGRVLEAACDAPFADRIDALSAELMSDGIAVAHRVADRPELREVGYPPQADEIEIDAMDAPGGMVANGFSLCQFMARYWLNGEPRRPGEKKHFTFWGSLPGTTALVCQREDDVNVAVLFNNRREANFEADLTQLDRQLNAAVTAAVGPDAIHR